MKRFWHLLFTLLLVGPVFAHDHVLPPGFAMEEDFVVGLTYPTDLKVAPDGRIFITEKGGAVRIVENDELLPQPFLTVATQTVGERGLDGIILDPDFDVNGYVYIYYTLPTLNQNVLVRVTAAGNTAVPGSEVELMRFNPMWASWHNGGGMVFDAAGKLIVGIGDGVGGTQGLGTTLGKVIRINTDGSIPTDNPFYNQASGKYRSIMAYGMRNPYTMAASRLSGKIFMNDVGFDTWEEVNELEMGKNYGWPYVEGPLDTLLPPDTNYVDPVYVYDHDYGCAVVGATFYEPDISLFPATYFGKYFFIEYCEGKILCMDPDSYAVTEFALNLKEEYNNLECSPDGYLYLINIADGNLARISYPGVNSPPFISVQPRPQIAAIGENATFTAQASGDTLTYEWYLNGNLVQSSALNSFTMFNVQLADDQASIYARVRNPHGFTISDTVQLTVVNGTRPTIQFQNLPATYAAGDTLYFSAQVNDADQQSVPLSAMTWEVSFHHDNHTHPAFPATSGISSGSYVVERYGEVDTNVFFRIHLSAEDSSGLITQAFADVLPEKVTLLIQSDPPGVEVNIDGSREQTDYPLRSVRNLNRTVVVPAYAVVGDTLYAFEQWWDTQTVLSREFAAKDDTVAINYRARQAYYRSYPGKGNLIIFQDTASNQQYYGSKEVSQVKENWDILNPYPWAQPPFPNDYWSARWEGTIFPPVSDWYTFYLLHDGKVSLTVGDSVLLDGRMASSALQEDSVQIWLNGGDSLALRLDYDHHTYLSRVELDWRYSIVPRQTVPFRSSVPLVGSERPFPVKDDLSDIFLFPNPSDQAFVQLHIGKEGPGKGRVVVMVYNELGQLLQMTRDSHTGKATSLDVGRLLPGLYLFRVVTDRGEKVLRFIKR